MISDQANQLQASTLFQERAHDIAHDLLFTPNSDQAMTMDEIDSIEFRIEQLYGHLQRMAIFFDNK